MCGARYLMGGVRKDAIIGEAQRVGVHHFEWCTARNPEKLHEKNNEWWNSASCANTVSKRSKVVRMHGKVGQERAQVNPGRFPFYEKPLSQSHSSSFSTRSVLFASRNKQHSRQSFRSRTHYDRSGHRSAVSICW